MTQLDRLARAILSGDTDYHIRWAQEHTAKRRRVKAKSAPRRKAVRASKEQRRENLATTRAIVWGRAKEMCEVCVGAMGVHLHHLYTGRGNRRAFEGPNATLCVCHRCHDLIHQSDPESLNTVIWLAQRIGAPDIVQAALGRRVDKARRGGAA